jgi:hypothetical protein
MILRTWCSTIRTGNKRFQPLKCCNGEEGDKELREKGFKLGYHQFKLALAYKCQDGTEKMVCKIRHPGGSKALREAGWNVEQFKDLD